MPAASAKIDIPEELLSEIDQEVGADGRAAFLLETLEAELRRRRLLRFLEGDEPAWKDEDHPDIAAVGTAEWVRSLRREGDRRIPVDEPETSAA